MVQLINKHNATAMMCCITASGHKLQLYNCQLRHVLLVILCMVLGVGTGAGTSFSVGIGGIPNVASYDAVGNDELLLQGYVCCNRADTADGLALRWRGVVTGFVVSLPV